MKRLWLASMVSSVLILSGLTTSWAEYQRCPDFGYAAQNRTNKELIGGIWLDWAGGSQIRTFAPRSVATASFPVIVNTLNTGTRLMHFAVATSTSTNDPRNYAECTAPGGSAGSCPAPNSAFVEIIRDYGQLRCRFR